jgi:hypothetical protein
MSSEEMNILLSNLNSLEREFELMEQEFAQRKQTLIEETKRPITRERAGQVLIQLGNLNYERASKTEVMKRKIQEIRDKIRQKFDQK